MPYIADRKVEDLINPAAVPRAGRRMTLKGGRRLHDETRRLTPVHVPEPGAETRLRKPGDLRRSVKRGVITDHVGVGTSGWQVRVYTDDPVAPHVEWSTRPHDIRPRADRAPASVVQTGRPRGTRQDGRAALRFTIGGRVTYARVVRHPGTRGVHMFARAATKVQVQAGSMFGPELQVFKRDLTARRPGR